MPATRSARWSRTKNCLELAKSVPKLGRPKLYERLLAAGYAVTTEQVRQAVRTRDADAPRLKGGRPENLFNLSETGFDHTSPPVLKSSLWPQPHPRTARELGEGGFYDNTYCGRCGSGAAIGVRILASPLAAHDSRIAVTVRGRRLCWRPIRTPAA